MKRLLQLIAIPSVICICISCTNYKVPGLVKELPKPVRDYPVWSIPQIELVHTAGPGTHFQWLMSYKDSPEKNSFPDSALFVISAEKGVSFEIQVDSDRGNPVILLWDRAIHKYDAYSVIRGYDSRIEIPGNPMALQIGTGGRATLCYTPAKDGPLRSWIWIVNGDYGGPGPFESTSYDEAMFDTLGITLSESEISQMVLMDSLSHIDRLSDVWNNRVTNKRNFKRTNVDIYLNSRACPSESGSADYYRDLLSGIDTLDAIPGTGAVSIAEMNEWYALNRSLDSLNSISFSNNRQLHQDGIVLGSEPFDLTLENRWLFWTTHPAVQAALLQRDEVYRVFPGETAADDLFRLRFIPEEGEPGFLKSPVSQLLAQTASELNTIGGAIYDSRGYLVAASQPFTFMNIYQDPTWEKIDPAREYVGTDCYSRAGYGFFVKKVFVPIKSRLDSTRIGWLAAEIYCR